MIPVRTHHPAGTIGVVSADFTRYADFAVSLATTEVPNATYLHWARGSDLIGNLNQCVDYMRGDWLWVLGDDHTWVPQVLLRLLDSDADVVVPLVSKRGAPFSPVIYSAVLPDGNRKVINWFDLPADPGLVEVEAAGTAGMLIRRHVLEKLPTPIFEAGRIKPNELGEDLWLCKKIREAGFHIYADTRVWLGHFITGIALPYFENGKWGVDLDLGHDVHVRLIPPKPGEAP